MGQFGFSKIEISFKSEKTPQSFKSKESILKDIDDELNVYNFNEEGESHITFELSSGRMPNLVYQIETVLKYIKEKEIQIEFFSSSTYVESDEAQYQFESNDDLNEII